LSIFYKYNYAALLVKKIKTYHTKIYLEKYTKPYKNPLHISVFLLALSFFTFQSDYKAGLKPLLTMNIFLNNYIHNSFDSELLVN